MKKHEFADDVFDSIMARGFSNHRLEEVSRDPLLLQIRVTDLRTREMPQYFIVKISEPI